MQERKLDGLTIERSTYYPAFGTGTSGPLHSYRIVRLRTTWVLRRSQFSNATIFSDPHPGRFVLPYAPMPPGDKPRLLKQRRLLHEASDLFGRKAIAEGLKISKATLDGWMKGGSEMPDTMLIALAHLLVRLA